MNPDYAALKAELAKAAYAGLADDPLLARLNASSSRVLVEGRRLKEGGLLDVPGLGLVAGHGALLALEHAAEADPLAARFVRVLRADGIDFGRPTAWEALDQLRAGQVLTAAVVDALKAYGSEPGPSVAAGLGFAAGVTIHDLEAARSR